MPSRSFLAIAVLLGLAGCAGALTTTSPATPPSFGESARVAQAPALRDASERPATCGVGVGSRIRKQGGAFHVPPCDGWKGLIRYPGATASTSMFTTSSTTNSFGAPAPPSGTAIFYLQTYLRHWRNSLRFGNLGVTDTVTSPALTSNHSYTLIVYRFLYDNQCNSESCPPWVMSLGSPRPGSHSITFVSPLNGAVLGPGSEAGPIWQFVQNP